MQNAPCLGLSSYHDLVSAGSISTHSTRHQCCPPGPVYEPIPSTWNSRNDGKRKKNARFEIRKERSSQTIDALIMASTVENETKEPKQQKHLLPDRQTAYVYPFYN